MTIAPTAQKKLRPLVSEVATAFPEAQVELWAVDEHRIGLKPLLRRVWAPKGQRPLAPVQHRYEWRCLVGFVHPASGRTRFHLATSVSIPLFEAELAAFARQVGAGPRRSSSWSWTERAGIPVCGCACPITSICTFCHPIPQNSSPLSTSGR